MNLSWESLSDIYNWIAALLILYGAALSAVWLLIVTDAASSVVMFIRPYIYLGEIFSPLSIGIAMLASGIGLLLKMRFGFILSAYTLTVWCLMSVIALFIAPMETVWLSLANTAVFGAALHRFVRQRDFFMQELPDIIQIISLLMFVGGYIGLSYGLNHIIYTSTLQTTLILGGGLLMMQASIGLAARSKVGLWFSMGVLLTAVLFDSGILLIGGSYENFYRLTLSAVAVYYLQLHKNDFYMNTLQ
jgi:hypothetical protein